MSDTDVQLPVAPVLHVKNGDEWVPIPIMRGEPGPEGPQGPQGVPGPPGLKGRLVFVDLSSGGTVEDQASNYWTETSFRTSIPFAVPAYMEGYARDFIVSILFDADPTGPDPIPVRIVPSGAGDTFRSYLAGDPFEFYPARGDLWTFGFTERFPHVFTVTKKLVSRQA